MKRFPMLTEQYIRERLQAGKTFADISRELGCTRSAVGHRASQLGIRPIICDKYIGCRFGKLVVKHRVGTYRKSPLYLCVCDCGQTATVVSYALKSSTQSCGCIRKRCGVKCSRFRGYEGISATFWGRVVQNAVSRNIEMAITVEDAWKLFLSQNGHCVYTGLALSFAVNTELCRHGGTNASLDRIDSSKGYVVDNIQWVHKSINIMKRTMSDKEFVELCILVADRRRTPTKGI